MFDLNMALDAVWGSLQLLFGNKAGSLGNPFWKSRSTQQGLHRIGRILRLVCSLLAVEDGIGSVVGAYLARCWCPRIIFGGDMASVRPISTIGTALPSFEALRVAAALIVVVVVVVDSICHCNCPSTGRGGPRGASG